MKIQVLAVHLRVIIVFQIYNNSTVQQTWDFYILDQVQSHFYLFSLKCLVRLEYDTSFDGALSGDHSVSDLQLQHSTTDMGFLCSRSDTVSFQIVLST